MLFKPLYFFVTIIFLNRETTGKVYNILHCHVNGDLIMECDGTVTPITAEHERALDEYMNKLAAYYRIMYPSDHSATVPTYFDPPSYPQLCKDCSNRP